MEECPPWYPLIRAAKYLGVPPWELLEQPTIWVIWAHSAEVGEIKAQEQRQARAKKKAI